MRAVTVIALTFLLAASAPAAPFVNLNFEQATVPTGTPPSDHYSATAAFPGWTPRIGNVVQTTVNYDYDGTGGACVVLYDRDPGTGGWSVPEGKYAVELVTDFPDGFEGSL